MNYQKITNFDTANGIGIRVTLWVSGCDHHCKGCHNPQTWDYKNGKPFGKEEKEELFRLLGNEHIHGLTISGGDPLAPKNTKDVANIVWNAKLMYPDKDVWVYTGYTLAELVDRANNEAFVNDIIRTADVIVDGEYVEALRDVSYPWAGSSNQHIWRYQNFGWNISKLEREYRNAKNSTRLPK